MVKKSHLAKANFQAVSLEIKKMACKSETAFIEVQNCSLQTPTKKMNILHLRVVFIKEVKSLTVIIKDTVKLGNLGQFAGFRIPLKIRLFWIKFHVILNITFM